MLRTAKTRESLRHMHVGRVFHVRALLLPPAHRPRTKHNHNHRDWQPLHQPTTPAAMAKIPRPSRSHKRFQHTSITATPLRRSRRIAFREPFRFNDLPPELRNAVYGLVLDSGYMIKLGADKLPATANALSQVSRTVRAESLSTYYSVNSFRSILTYWSNPVEVQQEISRIDGWFTLFGKLAALHIRALNVCHLGFYTLENDAYFIGIPTNRIIQITAGDQFFEEYRTAFLAHIVRQSNHSDWTSELDIPLLADFPIGIFQTLGQLRLQPDALRLLLTGLQLAIPRTTQPDPPLIAAALLSQLE
jgi:hypothetical protein